MNPTLTAPTLGQEAHEAGLADLSTRAQLATYLKISQSTLARWRVEGKGPKVTKLGSAARYRKADVLAWLDTLA